MGKLGLEEVNAWTGSFICKPVAVRICIPLCMQPQQRSGAAGSSASHSRHWCLPCLIENAPVWAAQLGSQSDWVV